MMHTLRDKVSNQLSSLFSDSTRFYDSSSYSSSPCSTADNSKASPLSKGERSVSSYVSLIVSSLSLAGSRSNKEKHDFELTQPLPVRWSSKDLELLDEYSDSYHECNTKCDNEEFQKSCEYDKKSSAACKNKQKVETHDDNEDGASGRSNSDSDVFEEARDQQTPGKPLPHFMDESAFVSSELHELLQSCLPNIVKGRQWILLYSTMKHGISLRTLIRKSADLSGPCLLIAGDRQGAVFGGLLECPLKPTAKRKYQGTNQSFVFTTIYGEPRLFKPTGANRFYYMCLNDLLALGGGDNFALRLDGDLLNGTSGPSETYGNKCLAHGPEFELKNVELWGFTHLSKYLT